MTGEPERNGDHIPRDAANWAPPMTRLSTAGVPEEALAINLEGRRVVGPLQGFGQLWQKTYWVRLAGSKVTPAQLIKDWKENFPRFWPKRARFYTPITGIAPGEVAALNVDLPGRTRLSTGVMVLYADDESFTFMSPEGHIFAGWITFSAHESEGATVAQTQVLIRANDPIYEVGFRLFGSKKEDEFWLQTLESLAAHFDVTTQAQMTATCVDPKVQWSEAKNLWQNAAIRSVLYGMATPVRWALKPLRS